MTLKEAIEKAVAGDARTAVKVAGKLRGKGMNYRDVYRFVNNCSPISEADWETLLYEGDWEQQ